MRKLALIGFALSIGTLAKAGVTVGNGGDAVVCFNDITIAAEVRDVLKENNEFIHNRIPIFQRQSVRQAVQAVSAWDLYIYTHPAGLYEPARTIFPFNASDPGEAAVELLNRLGEKARLGDAIRDEALKNIPYDSWIPALGVPEIYDSSPGIYLPESCVFVQIARQTKNLFGATEVQFDPFLFGKMDLENQTALILHEYTYYYAIHHFDHQQSNRSVWMVGLILSRDWLEGLVGIDLFSVIRNGYSIFYAEKLQDCLHLLVDDCRTREVKLSLPFFSESQFLRTSFVNSSFQSKKEGWFAGVFETEVDLSLLKKDAKIIGVNLFEYTEGLRDLSYPDLVSLNFSEPYAYEIPFGTVELKNGKFRYDRVKGTYFLYEGTQQNGSRISQNGNSFNIQLEEVSVNGVQVPVVKTENYSYDEEGRHRITAFLKEPIMVKTKAGEFRTNGVVYLFVNGETRVEKILVPAGSELKLKEIRVKPKKEIWFPVEELSWKTVDFYVEFEVSFRSSKLLSKIVEISLEDGKIQLYGHWKNLESIFKSNRWHHWTGSTRPTAATVEFVNGRVVKISDTHIYLHFRNRYGEILERGGDFKIITFDKMGNFKNVIKGRIGSFHRFDVSINDSVYRMYPISQSEMQFYPDGQVKCVRGMRLDGDSDSDTFRTSKTFFFGEKVNLEKETCFYQDGLLKSGEIWDEDEERWNHKTYPPRKSISVHRDDP